MGDFSELTIKLLFLFLPGIIYCILLYKLTFRPKKDFNFFLIYSFIFGIMIYGIYSITKHFLFGKSFEIYFLKDLFIHSKTFHYSEVFWVSLLGILLAIGYSWFTNNKKLHFPTFLKIYNKLNITRKFDRIDVWSEIFSTPDPNYSWVLITDFDANQKYEGWINKFSDNVKDNELFIRDVIVYDMSDNELYRTPALYITRKSDSITIEFFMITKGKHYNRYKAKGENTNAKKSTEQPEWEQPKSAVSANQ